MNRTVRADLRQRMSASPPLDLAPDRARLLLQAATLALGEPPAAPGWPLRLGPIWRGALEPALLTTFGVGWLAWVALQMAALAR